MSAQGFILNSNRAIFIADIKYAQKSTVFYSTLWRVLTVSFMHIIAVVVRLKEIEEFPTIWTVSTNHSTPSRLTLGKTKFPLPVWTPQYWICSLACSDHNKITGEALSPWLSFPNLNWQQNCYSGLTCFVWTADLWVNTVLCVDRWVDLQSCWQGDRFSSSARLCSWLQAWLSGEDIE